MRFNCGMTPDEKARERQAARELRDRYLSNWHPFFALWPRQVASGDCRWLEWIERKGTYEYRCPGLGNSWGWSWEYRARGL